MWIEGFQQALSGTNIFWLLLGTVTGLIVGVLPALGANFGVALMLPLTFGMEPATAVIFLVAIHAACNYGDSIASILINVPGGPGTVATCWDGYPLAQQGKPGKAIGIATFSSFIGGLGCWVTLLFLVRPITKLALAIGAPEYFALGLTALCLVAVASKGETIKGLIMAGVGLVLSFVGPDPVSGLTYRFGFGISALEGGIPIVVATLGIFATSQVLVLLEEGGSVAKAMRVKDSIFSGFREVVRRPLTLLRAGAVGWYVGILPALGVAIAGILAYLTEKKYSRDASQFGKGAPAGLIAAEVGKGACVVGDLIPSLTLGVPGSVTGALIMAALIIHGVDPGPRFLLSGTLPYTVFAGIVLAQASFLISGLLMGRWIGHIVYLPNAFTGPAIAILTFLGAYTERNQDLDVFLAVAFGAFAYALAKMRYSIVCLVLGLILGPLIETNFHRSLSIALGSYSIFVTRPIAVAFLSVALLSLAWPHLSPIVRRLLRLKTGSWQTPDEPISQVAGVKGELVLLVTIGLSMTVLLLTARAYKPAARLFPTLVCFATLLLTGLHGLGVLRRLSKAGGPVRREPSAPLFSGRTAWYWSLAAMAGFTLLMYLFGFIIATLVYLPAVIFLTGEKRWGQVIASCVLGTVILLLFAKAVHIDLPPGLFGLQVLR